MNSDLISREDLQYSFDNLCPHIECKKCRWYSMVDLFHKCALIDNAPTVELDKMTQNLIDKVNVNVGLAQPIKEERPQGKWGKHGECPFCSYIKQWEDDKFCGNCGAKLGKGGAE